MTVTILVTAILLACISNRDHFGANNDDRRKLGVSKPYCVTG